jgi:hypothetical protein
LWNKYISAKAAIVKNMLGQKSGGCAVLFRERRSLFYIKSRSRTFLRPPRISTLLDRFAG